MALTSVEIQGSDGVKQEVLVDTITGQSYAMSVYKMAFGDVGIDDGVISASNPLPIFAIEPRSSYGELSVINPTPIVQLQFPYNINTDLLEERNNKGTSAVVDNKLTLSTGAAANQSSQVLSKTAIKYNPGQGGLIRFSGLFTTGVANSTQYIGVGSSGDGFFFGFNGASFGILRRRGGLPEIRVLQITAGSTTAENVTITLDGVAKADVAVTNTGDATLTANEIASSDYSEVGKGWISHSLNDLVFFESYDSASGKTGTYSLSNATTAIGTFTQSIAGVISIEEFIAKEDFNIDVLDGTGMYKSVFDPTKGNVFEVRYQWLGFGAIDFGIEDPESGIIKIIHRIAYSNANTVPSISNPNLPVCISVENTTNTSDIVLGTSSVAGFVEGINEELGPSHATSVEASGIGTAEVPILSLHNHTLFQGELNKIISVIDSVNVSVDGTKPVTIRVRKNTTLTGASFSAFNANTSVVFIDTTATATTGGSIVLAKSVNKTGSIEFQPSKLLLLPREVLTITVEASASTTDAISSVSWTERI